MLWHDRVADPAARDETTTALRELGKTLRDDDGLVPCCCPSATGCSSPSSAEAGPALGRRPAADTHEALTDR